MSEKIGVAFAATPTWIVRAPKPEKDAKGKVTKPGLTRNAKLLYSVLGTYSRQQGSNRQCTVARSTLARDMDCGERAVDVWLKQLCDFGAIEIESGGGRKSNTYHLLSVRKEVEKLEPPCRAPLNTDSGHPSTQEQGTPESSCAAPPNPAAQVLEKSKKEAEKSERETARETGQPDELKTLRVTHESPPVKFKPAANIDPEPNTFGDAFDATPTEPPPAENARVKSLTGYVFALFATKAPASQNRIAKMRAANPPRHEADIVQSVIAKDPSLTRDELKDLFEFATTHERYWRAAANDPVKFAKNLSRIATDFASDQPVRR